MAPWGENSWKDVFGPFTFADFAYDFTFTVVNLSCENDCKLSPVGLTDLGLVLGTLNTTVKT